MNTQDTTALHRFQWLEPDFHAVANDAACPVVLFDQMAASWKTFGDSYNTEMDLLGDDRRFSVVRLERGLAFLLGLTDGTRDDPGFEKMLMEMSVVYDAAENAYRLRLDWVNPIEQTREIVEVSYRPTFESLLSLRLLCAASIKAVSWCTDMVHFRDLHIKDRILMLSIFDSISRMDEDDAMRPRLV